MTTQKEPDSQESNYKCPYCGFESEDGHCYCDRSFEVQEHLKEMKKESDE